MISPARKELRERSGIRPLLESNLTNEHFCFTRKPMRKPTSRASFTTATLATATNLLNIGKRVSKNKNPKNARQSL